MRTFGLGVLFTFLILVALAVNFVAIPLIIQAVLSAFGVQLSYWLALGLWVVVLVMLNILSGARR